LQLPEIFNGMMGKNFPLSYICDMKRKLRYSEIIICLLVSTIFLSSCITYQYIRDEGSMHLQKKIQGKRTANILGGSFLTAGSVVLGALTGIYIGYTPGMRNLKSVRLINQSTDTLQVNLLSDQIWKDSVYCDIRDVRIPPGEKCRILIPATAQYNLYFSNTMDKEEDDEIIQFNPNSQSKFILYPGMTVQPTDSTKFLFK
jgi:hypothetical protein